MDTDVLIVGAGPTGLMLACQLALYDIPFHIIEKNEHPTKESRAVAIQARSLEIFEQMGIIKEFTSRGQHAVALNYIVGNITRHIPLKNMGEGLSQFPFLYMLEQSKTEMILNGFLKKHTKKVEWSTELVSLEQNLTEVRATIKKSDGKEEKIKAKYVVGSDGAHSVVRHALGIPLAGGTYHQLLFVLDCKVSSPIFRDNEIYLSLSHNTFTAFFPLAHNKWRIIGVVPDELTEKKDITFEDIQKHFSERLSIPVTISDPNWISVYHSHHRHVSHFREGRCFLAGDAAHIHSPVGAQGMNTGLQDAYNLAWKLAFVLQKKANPSLLNSYNEERLPFAKKLVASTDRAFSLVVSQNIVESVVAKYIVPLVMKVAVQNSVMKKFIFTTVSQIGINYRKSPISHNATFGDFPKNSPLPGDRVPFIKNDSKWQNTNLISPTKMELVIFSDEVNIIAQFESIIKKYHEAIHLTQLPKNGTTTQVYEAFGISESGYYLIRPDMYIALRSNTLKTEYLENYLELFFN